MPAPLCFVLMPFGRKPVPGGGTIDFDAVYRDLIAPGIAQAGMEPVRADGELTGGIIHKPMYERLILCEFAVADLTTANANVFYELGVRHAVRPHSTVLLFAEGEMRLPFDVAPLRALPYTLTESGVPAAPEAQAKTIAERLQHAQNNEVDSPLYQLVEDFPDVQRLKTDVFRERVEIARDVALSLEKARKEGVEAVRAVEATMAPLAGQEASALVDLLLSFRAVSAWDDMIRLSGLMPPELARTVLVREQRGLALNRAGRGDEAERVLTELIDERGPSSETCSILGRIYKDRWEAARDAGKKVLARGELEKAIAAYLRGFETDWRDAFPGINTVTLMELRDPPDPRRVALLPVVRYAVERRVAAGRPDYWDHVTRLELAVLAEDEAAATEALADALAAEAEGWQHETTARNLRLVREAREARGTPTPWLAELERELAP